MAELKAAPLLARAEDLCRRRGVRLTAHRRQVLEIIERAGRPVGAYEILEALRGAVKNPAPPTVYRALDFLLEQGLVHKLESLHAFVGCVCPGSPHSGQFLICNGCGAVSELQDETIAKGLRTVADASGFAVDRDVVEVLGTCAHCMHHARDQGPTQPNQAVGRESKDADHE